MATEISSIARPYAEAVFAHASENGRLDLWSEMLSFMATAIADDAMKMVIGNPAIDQASLTELLLDIGGGRLSDECQNLIKLLVINKKVPALPEIAAQFEALKNQSEGAINVVITSAFEMKPAQEKLIADALKKKFSREVNVRNEIDENLIGGIRIKAGDMVIDGSIKGQLHKLANELGI
jgi:F-type H+-transporting ATPase subunit delta